MIAVKVQQDSTTTKYQAELGRKAELDYAESMMYSGAGLNNGLEAAQAESTKTTPDVYTMQLSAILAEHAN